MNPLLGHQLQRQTILLDEQQLQELKHKQPTKETVAATGKSPGSSAQTPYFDSILEAEEGGRKAEQLNDGLTLRMAHPKLIHPTPVVATKHSPILEAIDKLEILALTMDLTSEKARSEEEQKSVLTNHNCPEPQETSLSPKVKALPPSTAPSNLTLDESQGTQHNGRATTQSNTSNELPAIVVAYPSKTPVSPPLASSTQSTISTNVPLSAISSTRSPSSLLEMCTDAPITSSSLRTSSNTGTLDTIIIRHGHLESSPHSVTSHSPKIPRALPFVKKRSSLYTHQSLAHSESQIDHHVPYSAEVTRSNDIRQSGSVLASTSSTFFNIGSPSCSRSYSNTSSMSLATTQPFATTSNSTRTKRVSQLSHDTCTQPPSVPTNLTTNSSTKSSNLRPFPHFFNTGHQYPMSTPSHFQSTPALLSHHQVDVAKEPSALFQTGCTCRNKQISRPCLFHKKLPSLPVSQLDDPTALFKEKTKSSRISIMPTAASIRSFVASIKKPRSKAASIQSLAELDGPFSRESQLQSRSNTSLPLAQPEESTKNYGPSLTTSQRRNRKEPSSIVRRAVKRHAGADVPLSASPGLSKENLDFQKAKRHAVYGLKGQTSFPSNHSSRQSLSSNGQLYLCPMSVSTPCLVHSVPFTKATTGNKYTARSVSTTVRIQQATESTPNLSLQGRAHVTAVNAHAEIVVQPHFAGTSAISRQGGVIANSNAFIPPIEPPQSFLPASSPAHRTGPYSKENITFFEPFQALPKSRGGNSSSYVSFHFDLSHLEKAEHKDEYDSASTTKANVDRTEQDSVDGSDGDDDENVMNNLRYNSSSPPVHPSISLPNVTLSSSDLLPVHLRNRVILPPPPPPPRTRPQGAEQEDSSSDKNDGPFQTLHQHLRKAPTSASASSPSLRLPSQPQSDQQHPLKRLLGYSKDKPKHWSHNESLSRTREATNSSTVSLPVILSSFLPSSASTASLPIHPDQTHLGREPRLAGRGSKPWGNKWNWMWWKNSSKSSDTDKHVSRSGDS